MVKAIGALGTIVYGYFMINMMIRVDALGRRRLLDPRDCLYCRPHPDEAAKILDAHYLGRDKRLADSAIEKLEKLKAKDQ